MGNLYPLKIIDNSSLRDIVASHQEDQTLKWHHSLGHLSLKSVKTIQAHKLVEGKTNKPF